MRCSAVWYSLRYCATPDFRVADLRQLIGPEIGEDVANAEEAEADHDQPGERPREWRGRRCSST